ncbi:Oligo-1,6-glucosidase [Clostridiales bacterium CHKCI006]|nr:Oligo-1,6-glucosidase [Clostridiales bacterium CHKCI006]
MLHQWKEQIVYQIYPRSFKDSNHDGIGDIPGIIEKLDYLKKLGVTMLWVCPVYRSPMADNGYDILDYYDINPEFGTMADVDRLIAEAKKRDMYVIMDLVINHTSDEHAWFQEALKDPQSPYRDYYIFKEGKDGHAPTNWRSVFGGSVWEPVPGEDNMYYFHAFAKKQPDLNWENPKMRQDIYQMINFWLEKGIAGFRVDAINFMKKNQDWPDGKPDGADGLSACFPFSRNVPGIEVFFKELRENTFDKYQCFTVAEAVGVAYDKLDIFIGDTGCFNMLFDFSYANLDVTENEEWFPLQNWTIKAFKEALYASQVELAKVGWNAPFFENHDMQRSMNRLIRNEEERTPTAAKMLGALLLSLKGTPFIYQGEEIGMINNERSDISEFDDISSHNQYQRALEEGYTEKEALMFVNRRSRDNTRSPMCFDDSEYAGFSDVKPWLKVNEHASTINVASQLDDPNSVFNFYVKMIALRQSEAYHDTFVDGDFVVEPEVAENVIAFSRKLDNTHLLCVYNFQNEAMSYPLSGNPECLLSNEEVEIDHQMVHLKPYQACIFKM